VGILNLVDPLGGVAVKHESSLPGSARRKRGIGFIGDGYARGFTKQGEPVSEQQGSERTTGGLAGKVLGKVKQAAGSVTGRDELAREGRLQDAQADAELEARRDAEQARGREQEAQLQHERTETELQRRELENEVAAQQREQQAEQDRHQAEAQAQQEAQQREQAAQQQRDSEHQVAEQQERQTETAKLSAQEEAIRLEREARAAEERAQNRDPEAAR